MELDYVLLDVFTKQGLQGNPLAVICNGDGLLDNEMQAIAQEFGLSETVFLSKPQRERNSAAMRIFTPKVELPFAGHPTVGAAVVIATKHKVPVVRIEEKVGLITALVERGDRSGSARFGLPRLPEEIGKPPDIHATARALGILAEEIGCGLYRPATFTAGTLFYLIPVKNADVLRRLRLERRGWSDVFPLEQHAVYVFTETPQEKGIDFAARMFSPGMGIGEDPGTGAAAAALTGLVARNVSFDDGQAEFILRQGVEMGRPCRIVMQIKKDSGTLTHAGIGGDAVIIGEGKLRLG